SGRLGEIDARIRSPLEIAQRNGMRLSRLVDNILLAQKIDVDALSLDALPVDLGTLLKESLEENKMFAAEQKIDLVLPKGDQTATITGDAFALRQIIDNLVSNAIKFSEQGSTVEGSLSIRNGHVRLSIKDSGRGIPDGMEGQVFGRFEQVKNGGQYATQGSGLGLHISQQLARQMSGKLFYDSVVGEGTTFHMEFATVAAQQPAVILSAADNTDATPTPATTGDTPEAVQA
ncbi:MAG TPA: ATPase, partial [Sulfitobacter pontiacus]